MESVVQLTGKDLVPHQTLFESRTPADPIAFIDEATGEAHIYGTQVEGSGMAYLKFKSLDSLLQGTDYELVNRDVYLPNGEKLVGKEAIWDTYRLAYRHLKSVFPNLDEIYEDRGIRKGTDLYYAGIAIARDGRLGRFPTENWRRRIYVFAERWKGRLQVLPEPAFNPIPFSAQTSDYIGFAQLPSLPGNYLGHAYGPHFKITERKSGERELWMIHEEVSRRVEINGRLVEATEIYARKMLDPFTASPLRVELVGIEIAPGLIAPDACRGPQLNYAKLLEGFRPTQVEPQGVRITRRAVRGEDGVLHYVEDASLAQKEYFFLIGSSGNFAGDDYDVIMAVREGSAIGPYRVIPSADGTRWKRYLEDIKRAKKLSWAGRGSFVQGADGQWWILFHAVDKSIKPDGSYGGEIPPNTEEYHRNIYLAPIEFVINLDGQPDMVVI